LKSLPQLSAIKKKFHVKMGDGFVLTAKTFWQKIIIYPIPIWGLIFEQTALPQEALS
jgi:hypothetical protein